MRNPYRDGPTLLVASTGGHLEQLFRLRRRFLPALDGEDWVTFDTDQSRTLLDGLSVDFIPYLAPKDLKGSLATVPLARRLLRRRRYARVVSTGAAIAPPFFLAARSLGIPCHYIESSARSQGPSLSGKMAGTIPGVRLYAQYPSWAAGRWQYRGAVFDGFTPAPAAPEREDGLARIVVTFGTQRGFSFRRAAERLAKVLPEVCAPDAEILWQTGSTDVTGVFSNGAELPGVDSLPPTQLHAAMAQADLVIAHAGIGSALAVLEMGKCPVLLPRRHSRHEHTDDHQTMIAAELGRRGLAVSAEADEITADELRRAAGMRATAVADPALFALQPD
jgi:UDP-N-acetylglucosamine--N-acetylmuramyl-(pentapeptide) pyrophosphoryl-undecaprenol N-acetylglucosamine transferase